ncbi:MAG: hypothetical protein NUV65_01570 [Candidatus Roizmanbacteria bacterium]|nr:hypothetical protein [Candidatus Roizmanbacteria bacterium]
MGKKKQITVGVQEKKKDVQVMDMSVSTKKPNKMIKKAVKTRGTLYKKAKLETMKKKLYSIKDAVTLLKKVAHEKFPSPVELHLNVQEVGLRGEVALPHGTGKTINVVIFDDSVEKDIKGGTISFDILIARPDDMKRLVPYARLLGPKGLMPSPKKGTVSETPEKALKKFQKGAVHYKTEAKAPIVHQVVGLVSFNETQLIENVSTFIRAVETKNIRKAFICTAMSPSLILDLSSIV